MPKANPAPRSTDFQQALADMPDGPNVAPSAHEHEAAQGRSTLDDASTQPDAQAAESAQPPVQPDQTGDATREQQIQHAAYVLASERGFEPGRELDDWLEAERRFHGNDVSASQAQPAAESTTRDVP